MIAESQYQLGHAYYLAGNSEDALIMLHNSLVIRRNLYGNSHPDVAASANLIGAIHFWRTEFVEAEIAFKEALDIRIKCLGELHEDVASSLNNLGNVQL